MTKKIIINISIWILISLVLFLTGGFIYVFFIVPDHVKIVAVYEDNTFKMATEPNDLLQSNKKLSRFTAVYFDLENHTKEICQGTIKTKNINDNLNLAPEDGYANFLPKSEKVNIEFCGQKMTLDLSRL